MTCFFVAEGEGVRTLKRLNIRQFQVLKMMSGAVGR